MLPTEGEEPESQKRERNLGRNGGRAERGPTNGASEMRLVICKKFIFDIKKERKPEGSDCPLQDGSWTQVGVGGQVPWPGLPRLALRAVVGTGHRLTDSQTQSRADGSRINNFIYTWHTVCTALLPALARGWGKAAGLPHSPSLRVSGLRGEGFGVQLNGKGESAAREVAPPAPEGCAGGGVGGWMREVGTYAHRMEVFLME